jgi:hypothetical protein
MNNLCRAAVGAIVSLLVLASPALAARPQINLDAATRYHDARMAKYVTEWNADEQETYGEYKEEQALYPELTDEWIAAEVVFITSYSTGPCEQETRYRALCSFTAVWSDGSICDTENDVVVKRSGRFRLVWDDDEDACS